MSTSRSSHVGSLFKNEDRNQKKKKKDGAWRNKTLVKRASIVHDVTNSQTAWHEMAALTAVFETFKRQFFTNQIIDRLKTAVKSFFPILIDMARDATSLRSLKKKKVGLRIFVSFKEDLQK